MSRRDPEPRLLTQGQAAAYCGVCAEVFKKACPVKPINLLERVPRYDRHALDRWIDTFDNSRPIGQDNIDLGRMWDAGDNGARQGH
jgi:hypothetical protein